MMKIRNLLILGIYFFSVNLVSQVAAPAQPIAQPAVAPVVPAPVAAAAPVAVSYEKDFEDINKNLTETLLIKKTLKEITNEVNDKLLDARKKVLEAQRLSFNVLQKTQAEAESLIAQAASELQKLQVLQNAVQTDLAPKFDANVKKVEELIKTIQTKVAELQAKGLKFQVAKSQEQAQPTAATTVAPQASAVTVEGVPVVAATAQVQAKEPTFYGKAWDWTTDKTASAANYARKTWKKFRNWAFKPDASETPVSDDSKKNFKYAGDSEQILKYQAPASENTVTASLDVVKKYVAVFQSGASDIENQLNSILQRYLVLRLTIKSLEKTLMSNDEFKGYLDYCEAMDPWWKRHITQNFNDFLDCCVVFYAATKKVVIRAYNYLFAGLVNKFLSDVEDKMKRDEAQDVTQSALPAQAPEQKTEEANKQASVPAMSVIQ